MIKQRWDIFCKVVDNFGDIGVCWRLAQQLQHQHSLQVRLWVDDIETAQKIVLQNIATQKDLTTGQQNAQNVTLLMWDTTSDFSQAADVVIEAFACELPAAYLAAMVQQKSTWVNLEYLSAEPWVDDFHGKPSPQSNGLTRYFYFPGFTEKTGGLIRENYLSLLNQSVNQHFKLNNGVQNHLKVSLFCYPNAPVLDLLSVLTNHHQMVDCYVPATNILPVIAPFFGLDALDIGKTYTLKRLNLHVLPFLSQADYDQLLSVCDINYVRGEDSWVRAIWAQKPFIWQPYLQTENTHITKLNAFLDFFYAGFTAKQPIYDVHQSWSAGQMSNMVLQDYLNHLSSIQTHTKWQAKQLANQPDLATQLVDFCNKI